MHLEEREREIWACAFCNSMCRHVCTVAMAAKLESTQPKGKGMIEYSILKGEGEFSEGAIERMYMCVDCGRCRVWCITGISDCSRNVQAGRADIVELGRAPRSILKWKENASKYRSLYEVPVEERFKKVKGLPELESGADTLYFVGCTTAQHQPEIAESTLKILKSMGEKVVVARGEVCCGYPLWAAGFRENAKQLAEENVENLKSLNIKRVVTSCPECYLALKERYREWGVPVDLEVFHIAEYLDKRRFKLRPSKKLSMSVVYHDPCHLGRRAGIYDEPRRLLAAIPGLKVGEIRWSRENSLCCGGGGGLPVTYPELSKTICEKALADAKEGGAEALVTACPFCKQMFLERAEDFNLKVYDIVELLA